MKPLGIKDDRATARISGAICYEANNAGHSFPSWYNGFSAMNFETLDLASYRRDAIPNGIKLNRHVLGVSVMSVVARKPQADAGKLENIGQMVKDGLPMIPAGERTDTMVLDYTVDPIVDKRWHDRIQAANALITSIEASIENAETDDDKDALRVSLIKATEIRANHYDHAFGYVKANKYLAGSFCDRVNKAVKQLTDHHKAWLGLDRLIWRPFAVKDADSGAISYGAEIIRTNLPKRERIGRMYADTLGARDNAALEALAKSFAAETGETN